MLRRASARRIRVSTVIAFAVVIGVVAVPLALAASFTNADGITFPAVSGDVARDCYVTADPAQAVTASPYPSQIVVSGLQDVEDVNATVTLRHRAGGDVAILLVGPTGASTILASDSGYDYPVGCCTGDPSAILTFDDAATESLPAVAPLTTGTYKPTHRVLTNHNSCTFPGSFPSPAPAAGYGTTLSVFDGTDPNGTWKLYAMDDTRWIHADGSISSWSLDITAAADSYTVSAFNQPVDNPPTVNVAKVGKILPFKFRVTDQDGSPVTSLATTDVSVQVELFPCTPGGTRDAIESYASSTGLKNRGDGYYRYGFKTLSRWEGTCGTLTLTTPNGGERSADFKFKE